VTSQGRLPTLERIVELRQRPRQKLSGPEQLALEDSISDRRVAATFRAILRVTSGNDYLKCRLYPDPADPAKRTLVERTGIARRTLQRHLAWLVDEGYLVCQQTGNRGRLPIYRVLHLAEREEWLNPAPPPRWEEHAEQVRAIRQSLFP
jgi:hypothetical protein